jgi:hypothetical protein
MVAAAGKPGSPRLRLVASQVEVAAPAPAAPNEPVTVCLSGLMRQSRIDSIRRTARNHGLQFLVDHATMGLTHLEALSDESIVSLHGILKDAVAGQAKSSTRTG